jgi:hypothetical protein
MIKPSAACRQQQGGVLTCWGDDGQVLPFVLRQ